MISSVRQSFRNSGTKDGASFPVKGLNEVAVGSKKGEVGIPSERTWKRGKQPNPHSIFPRHTPKIYEWTPGPPGGGPEGARRGPGGGVPRGEGGGTTPKAASMTSDGRRSMKAQSRGTREGRGMGRGRRETPPRGLLHTLQSCIHNPGCTFFA